MDDGKIVGDLGVDADGRAEGARRVAAGIGGAWRGDGGLGPCRRRHQHGGEDDRGEVHGLHSAAIRATGPAAPRQPTRRRGSIQAWICAAASRPSRIAHTTSEAPRTMSPAANTPGSAVMNAAVVDLQRAPARHRERRLAEDGGQILGVEAERLDHQRRPAR